MLIECAYQINQAGAQYRQRLNNSELVDYIFFSLLFPLSVNEIKKTYYFNIIMNEALIVDFYLQTRMNSEKKKNIELYLRVFLELITVIMT